MADYTYEELISVPRDLAIVRAVLLAVDQSASTYDEIEVDEFSEVEVHAHIRMLYKAGFIEEQPKTNVNGFPIGLLELTWEGRELMSNLADEQTMQKAKRYVAEKAGSASVSIMAELTGKMLQGMILPDL